MNGNSVGIDKRRLQL